MNRVIIPLHSFVDLITNSSSEIFVAADANTVKAVKKLIDNVLKAAGSDKTASDLFDISLGYGVTDNETYDTKFVTKAEFEKIKEAYQEWEDDDQSGDEPRYDPRYTEDGFSNIIVTVKPDIPTEAKAAAKAAAKTLSDLTGLFQIDATYD